MDIQNNLQLQLAFDFVQFTGGNIFLTGKAVTGKTTFLHNLKKYSPKRMVIMAPTGVAAINASGVIWPGSSKNKDRRNFRYYL